MAPIGYGHKNEGYTDWVFCHSPGSPDIVILSGFCIGSDQPASDGLDCKDHSKLVVACRLNIVHVANLFPFPINSHTLSEYVPNRCRKLSFCQCTCQVLHHCGLSTQSKVFDRSSRFTVYVHTSCWSVVLVAASIGRALLLMVLL